ncbi:MAG: hypothetical protein AAGF57_09205 [Pseudomonadota bacterium]
MKTDYQRMLRLNLFNIGFLAMLIRVIQIAKVPLLANLLKKSFFAFGSAVVLTSACPIQAEETLLPAEIVEQKDIIGAGQHLHSTENYSVFRYAGLNNRGEPISCEYWAIVINESALDSLELTDDFFIGVHEETEAPARLVCPEVVERRKRGAFKVVSMDIYFSNNHFAEKVGFLTTDDIQQKRASGQSVPKIRAVVSRHFQYGEPMSMSTPKTAWGPTVKQCKEEGNCMLADFEASFLEWQEREGHKYAPDSPRIKTQIAILGAPASDYEFSDRNHKALLYEVFLRDQREGYSSTISDTRLHQTRDYIISPLIRADYHNMMYAAMGSYIQVATQKCATSIPGGVSDYRYSMATWDENSYGGRSNERTFNYNHTVPAALLEAVDQIWQNLEIGPKMMVNWGSKMGFDDVFVAVLEKTGCSETTLLEANNMFHEFITN